MVRAYDALGQTQQGFGRFERVRFAERDPHPTAKPPADVYTYIMPRQECLTLTSTIENI